MTEEQSHATPLSVRDKSAQKGFYPKPVLYAVEGGIRCVILQYIYSVHGVGTSHLSSDTTTHIFRDHWLLVVHNGSSWIPASFASQSPLRGWNVGGNQGSRMTHMGLLLGERVKCVSVSSNGRCVLICQYFTLATWFQWRTRICHNLITIQTVRLCSAREENQILNQFWYPDFKRGHPSLKVAYCRCKI